MNEKKLKEIEAREATFSRIEATLGKKATDALRDYYSIFDERYYLWQASLYSEKEDEDGNVIGGYYYSCSGRDTEGFEIDIESTMQAIGFLCGSGMIAEYGGDPGRAIPKDMQKAMVAFAKSLQSPEDGYFYHPQWGKNISTSRRGRDLDWAKMTFDRFGGAPLYDMPNGVKGTLGAPKGAGEKEGDTPVSTLPKELQSPENYKEYLESFTEGMKTNSYYHGNLFGSFSSQVVARGEEYVKVYENFANSLQNPENGLWEDSVHYDSINGLMKISGTYNALGIKFNHAEKALVSAIKMVTFEGEDIKGKAAVNGVDVFNPFIAIHNLFTNIKKYGDPAFVDKCINEMKKNAVEIITVSKRKVEQFKKPDGSYGYRNSTVPPRSQAAPVAVEGTVEGDINGGNLVVQGVSNFLCRSLGVEVVPLFYPSDFDAYLEAIASRKNKG